MKKELHYCAICGKVLDSVNNYHVVLPRIVHYKSNALPPQVTIWQEEICLDCCKKIAKFIDTI